MTALSPAFDSPHLALRMAQAAYRSDSEPAAPAVATSTAEPTAAATPVRVPRSIHDVDNGKILGFGAELAEDHPVGGVCGIRGSGRRQGKGQQWTLRGWPALLLTDRGTSLVLLLLLHTQGFLDQAYKQRRVMIADIARTHEM